MPSGSGRRGSSTSTGVGRLYGPPSRARELETYAAHFDTVELNVTFYRMPPTASFRSWAARVPDGFLYAVKASRYLTHIRRLRDPREPVEFLMERASELGPHLGPILLQLPPDMTADLDRTRGDARGVPAGHPGRGRAAPCLVVHRGPADAADVARRRPVPRRPARSDHAHLANSRLDVHPLPRRPGHAVTVLWRTRSRHMGDEGRRRMGTQRRRLRVLQQRPSRVRACAMPAMFARLLGAPPTSRREGVPSRETRSLPRRRTPTLERVSWAL